MNTSRSSRIICAALLALVPGCQSPGPIRPRAPNAPSLAVVTTLRIRVVLEGTDIPVAGAAVRLVAAKEGAWRLSDANGWVEFPASVAGQLYRVDIATAKQNSQPTVRDDYLSRFVRTVADQYVQTETIAVPGHRRLVLDYQPAPAQGGDQYPIYAVEFLNSHGAWQIGRVQAVESEGPGVAIIVSRPGTWRVLVHEGPFLVRYSAAMKLDAAAASARATLLPMAEMVENFRIRIAAPGGAPAAGALVRIASPVADLDPFEFEADADGYISLGRVNVDSVTAFVQGPAGAILKEVPVSSSQPAVLEILDERPKGALRSLLHL